MSFGVSDYSEVEIEEALARYFGLTDPDELCGFVIIILKHPAHEIGSMYGGVLPKAAGAMCLQMAGRYAKQAQKEELLERLWEE